MSAARRVGVLLPEYLLRRIVQQKPTWEAAEEYAKAAERLNMEAVLFSLNGYHPYRRFIRGYVQRGGQWQPWHGALPLAVHNRMISRTRSEVWFVRTLSRQLDGRLFNPTVSRDKWHVFQQLETCDGVKDYLPLTARLTPALCRKLPAIVREKGGVVVKPRRGSLGLGIAFIEAMPHRPRHYRWIPARGPARVVGGKSLVRLAARLAARSGTRGYIVQQTVPLMTYEDRRCDMRVPVQRDGRGQWCVVDATVKQATKHPYLTNIARGGKAYPYDVALAAVFGPDRAREVWANIQRLSLAVAERLTRVYPQLADIGLDIGVDAGGKPWLIEVNFRDQRLCSKTAGQADIHARLYYNPIAYAHFLIANGRREVA